MGMEIIPDEAYYWTWSRKLDLSFYDQGPGVALYIKFFTSIFGDTHFALKFAANIAGFIVSLLLYLTALNLEFSALQLLWVLLFTQLLPGFFGGTMLIMHDTPLLLFWS